MFSGSWELRAVSMFLPAGQRGFSRDLAAPFGRERGGARRAAPLAAQPSKRGGVRVLVQRVALRHRLKQRHKLGGSVAHRTARIGARSLRELALPLAEPAAAVDELS